MRVFGWKTLMRNESEKVGSFIGAPSTAPDYYYLGVSMSIHVGTRKMVNYA
jgi:hypothetical protein